MTKEEINSLRQQLYFGTMGSMDIRPLLIKICQDINKIEESLKPTTDGVIVPPPVDML